MRIFFYKTLTVLFILALLITPSASEPENDEIQSNNCDSMNSVKIYYRCGVSTRLSNTIRPYIQIENTGSEPIFLFDLRVRYWYSVDGDTQQNWYCNWAQMGSHKITCSFVKVSPPFPNADYYFEIGFTSDAGYLAPGANTGEIRVYFNKFNFTNYDQTNDYSFNPAMESYNENNKISAYLNGNLIYGTEPTIMPTPSPTSENTN